MSDLVRKSVNFSSRKSRATAGTLGNGSTRDVCVIATHRNALRERDLSGCSVADAGTSRSFMKHDAAQLEHGDETLAARAIVARVRSSRGIATDLHGRLRFVETFHPGLLAWLKQPAAPANPIRVFIRCYANESCVQVALIGA